MAEIMELSLSEYLDMESGSLYVSVVEYKAALNKVKDLEDKLERVLEGVK